MTISWGLREWEVTEIIGIKRAIRQYDEITLIYGQNLHRKEDIRIRNLNIWPVFRKHIRKKTLKPNNLIILSKFIWASYIVISLFYTFVLNTVSRKKHECVWVSII